MAKILLVEDDEDLAITIGDHLTGEHHTVEILYDGLDAMAALKDSQFEIVILDWDLPGLSGLEVLRKFRSLGGNTPVLMLTGKGKLVEKEQGLDSGADDYLTKPFEMRELFARVRSLLRRPGDLKSDVLRHENLVLDPVKYSLTRNGEELRLLPRDFALLEFLMRHPNEIFSAETLLARVWTYDSEASVEGLRVAIRRIRKVVDLEDDISTSVIENISRVGYRMRPPKN